MSEFKDGGEVRAEVPMVRWGDSLPEMVMSPTLMHAAMAEALRPLMAAIEHNSRAIEQLAALQHAQNERLTALGKDVRLTIPLTEMQARVITGVIRERAEAVCLRYGLTHEEDKPNQGSMRKISYEIRRGLYTRYGVRSVKAIPRCEFEAAQAAARMWMDAGFVTKLVVEHGKENGHD